MAELLNDTDVASALERLGEWQRDGASLVRTAALPSFVQAIAVVNRIAEIAENDNHHPDIDIRWRTLTFRCATHSAGGITALDVSMAEEIDQVIDTFASA